MGNTGSSGRSETINWNNVKTENMSSTIPNFTGLSKDALQLITNLNIPENVDSEVSEFNLNRMLGSINNTNLKNDVNQKFNQILEQVSAQSDELSNTSPFISSDMYNDMINSKTSESPMQKGGAKKQLKPKAKKSRTKASRHRGSEDDSDTSSTSSDSELEDLLDTTEEKILKKKEEKILKKKEEMKSPKKNNKDKKEESEDSISDDKLSYISSSAHTDGEFSDSNGKSNLRSDSGSDSELSVKNENKSVKSLSINTDDINMVSDYD